MDLKCKTGHLWGGEVLCNGTVYKISAEGIASNVSDDDAKKLLSNRDGWDPAPVAKPAKAPAAAAAPAKAAEASSALPPAPPPPPSSAPEADADEAAKRRSPPLKRG